MARRRTKLAAAALLLAALTAGGAWAWHETQETCCAAPSEPVTLAPPAPSEDRPKLGLMTSLPLYWSLDADFGSLASGQGEMPWQRTLIEQSYEIVPLDTLSPIPALRAQDPETDPLDGLERIAVIQPRGLSPADNVALDGWVRAGGRLLLVLDPMLTGHYEAALGDPRRPIDTALIPPVVERWGLRIEYDDEQPANGSSFAAPGPVPLHAVLYGTISAASEAGKGCEIDKLGVLARCKVGEGSVTLLADAALFEHREIGAFAQDGEEPVLRAFLDYPFAAE